MRPLWFIELIKKNFRHRFSFAKMSRLPILGTLIELMFFHKDALVYLPKDRVIQIELNQVIDTPINTVLPSQIVHSFIEQAKVHWIMDFCICRDSNNCQDYPTDLGCLFLGEAAVRIDPCLGQLVTKLGKRAEVHPGFPDRLNTFLANRNAFIHHFADTFDLGTDEGLVEAREYCQELGTEACRLTEVLTAFVFAAYDQISEATGGELKFSGETLPEEEVRKMRDIGRLFPLLVRRTDEQKGSPWMAFTHRPGSSGEIENSFGANETRDHRNDQRTRRDFQIQAYPLALLLRDLVRIKQIAANPRSRDDGHPVLGHNAPRQQLPRVLGVLQDGQV